SERLTLEQLADDVGESVAGAVRTGRADVVDRHAVRMIELPRRARLALEAAEAVLVLGERLGQDLDRDVPLQPGVPGAVDLAHPARAEERLDLVWPEVCALRNGGCHR